MKTIRDAIHPSIELSDAAVAIVDTPQMQRLRHVRQLGIAHLVYPSASHNRFEHSLGAMHLTGTVADRLVSDTQTRELLRLGALLHDVGHSAFSHLPEHLVRRYTGKTHEQLGEEKIRQSDISDALSAHGFSSAALLKLMASPLFGVVCTEYGTDRVDYLLRDAHFTGVSYSLVDAQRLLQSISLEDDRLVLSEKGVLPAESLLVSRYLMFRAVYHHHANRIASAMLENALEQALDENALLLSDLTDGRDDEVLFALKDHPLVDRIRHRRLFKTAFISQAVSPAQAAALEKALAAQLPENTFVVCPADQPLGGLDVPVRRVDGTHASLFSLSVLCQSLSLQLKAKEFIVAAAPEQLAEAKKIGAQFT